MTLLEVPVKDMKDIPIVQAYIDRLDLLTGHLMAYSQYLARKVKEYMKQ